MKNQKQGFFGTREQIEYVSNNLKLNNQDSKKLINFFSNMFLYGLEKKRAAKIEKIGIIRIVTKPEKKVRNIKKNKQMILPKRNGIKFNENKNLKKTIKKMEVL